MLHTASAPLTRVGSPIESGRRAGLRSDHPGLIIITRLGAYVRRARLQARLGSPTPTNTTSRPVAAGRS